MKILFCTNCYPFDEKSDYGIFVKEQIDNVKQRVDSYQIIRPLKYSEKGFFKYFRLFNEIRLHAKNYDLIHCFHGFTLLTALLATKEKKIICSYLNSIDNEFESNNKLLKKIFFNIFRFINRNNSRVHIIYKSLKINKNDYGKRAFYLPNGVNSKLFKKIDKEEACEMLNLSKKYNYILHVSSKTLGRSQKRYDIFVNVINSLQKNFPSMKFKPLIMTGVSRKDCPLYFSASSVHLLTSDFEGSPNSVKESLFCNTPVVSTDVGDVASILEGIDGCYVCDPSIKSLSGAVIQSFNQKKFNGRIKAKLKGLDMKTKSDNLLDIYKIVSKS